jgi:hypothetical protein
MTDNDVSGRLIFEIPKTILRNFDMNTTSKAVVRYYCEDFADQKSNRGHGSRRRWFFPLGTLVISGLVLGGANMDVGSTLGIHRPISMLEHAGGIQLSEARLEDHVPLAMHEGHTRYWLGALAGHTYTTNCVTPGILKVSYFRANQTLGDGSDAVITVTAYESRALYEKRLRPLPIEPPTNVENSSGDLLSYSATSLTELTIERNLSQEIITIHYSTPQSVTSMVNDSERLVAL